MEKTKVINIVGASGSGKTTIAKELEKTGYNIIQSYTTRPQREDGEWGHTFITIDKYSGKMNSNDLVPIVDKFHCKLHGKELVIKLDDMIAYFNSYNSGHHYFVRR